jgi:hypothetical protein
MHRRAGVLGCTLLIALLAGTFPVAATTITTTSYSTWNTPSYITGPTTVVDLTTLQAGLNYSNASGYTSSSGYIFTGPDGSSYVLSSQTEGSTTGLLGPSDGTGAIEVALPGAGNNAALLYAKCITCSSVNVTFSDGETFTISNGQFGFSISHDITWLELSTISGARPFLEYVYFATSSLPQDTNFTPASEAATPVLVGGGLMILLGTGRRKLLRRMRK